jgi:hypothetical protein
MASSTSENVPASTVPHQGEYQGTTIHIDGSWARVLWSAPVQKETLEWLPDLKPAV